MKKLLLISFTVLCIVSQAQQFAPIGAKWYYGKKAGLQAPNNNVQYYLFESIKDTLFNAKDCRKIRHREFLYSGNVNELEPLFVYQQMDTIFIYSSLWQDFIRMMVNGLSLNDSLLFQSRQYQTTLNLFVVTAIDTLIISNRIFRQVRFNNLPLNQVMSDGNSSYIDGVGSQNYFIPFYDDSGLLPEYGSGPLRCYIDENGIEFNFWGQPCDFRDAVSIEALELIEFDIYPNPASDYLALHFTEQQGKSYQITIVDMQGRVLHNKTSVNDGYDSILSLQGCAAGTYLIHIQQNGKRVGSKIFVKQ
jgi:hypothetical protein